MAYNFNIYEQNIPEYGTQGEAGNISPTWGLYNPAFGNEGEAGNVAGRNTPNPTIPDPNLPAFGSEGEAGNVLPTENTTNEFIFPKGEEVKPYSGLPASYRDMLLGFIMPQLQSSVGNIESNIDQYTQNALNTYRQEFENFIKEAIPKQVGNLANRGILNSSMAENVLSQTYSDALRNSAGMGYQTAMKAAEMKTQIPQTLGQLLQFGQYSEDPTVMYKTLAGLLAASMP